MIEGATPESVSCTLDGAEFQDRVAEWREIGRHALDRSAGEGSVTTMFPNRPEIVEKLRVLIDAEKSCCDFLEFTLRARGDVLEMELRYPSGFESTLARLTADER
jgi:hypothetical protein